MTHLQNIQDIRNELRSTCDSNVNEMLYNFVGPDALDRATEAELLSYIKSVAVKTIHPEVYRQQFISMRQSDSETITHFISRLKSQAMLCNFSRKCDCDDQNCEISYSENMIMSQVIAGLLSSSHRTKILSEMTSIETLTQMTDHLLTLEATAQATEHFKPSLPAQSDVSGVKSDYQRNKRSDLRQKSQGNNRPNYQEGDRKCRGCGHNRHPKGREQCPAQGKKYGVPHGQWENDKFIEQKPSPQPTVNISISLNSSAHQKLCKSFSLNKLQPTRVSAIADTGAQTCTAGIELLSQLNCSKNALIKTRHRLRAVNNNDISIKGAIIADITVGTSTTTEIVYLCDKVKGFFLSKTALKKLNIVHSTFPEQIATSQLNATDSPDDSVAEGGCPRRSPCPPIPDTIPFPATPEYTEQLEVWIKTYFSSSAFNTCKHQKLQVMTGEPLKIQFREDENPVSVHKPIPVPHHWKESVKDQLDQDVNLGIVEPVPTGTPTNWCSRMITVPKNDGTPRRTFHRKPKKTTLDAWNGYHSVPLANDAKEATTFITEWGSYRYLRAPQGFHGSGDGYTKRFDDITNDFPRVQRCVDDSILWNSDIATAFWHTMNYITLCANNGIVFNPEKFQFAKDTVEFAGFVITPHGYKPNQKILKGI
ncbi:uncharacterized protein LOC130630139 [Hydractinia symbiolongicarpus]|uniref:uncharacterized protein LOC130630139 n=1 Tax=Hydractinia symbiolongicarpus TaxID=13093 RepID=UPI00254A260A|nr:uncharacterized protein LOC130630139 [Hydractinia symbiolongicarpus]